MAFGSYLKRIFNEKAAGLAAAIPFLPTPSYSPPPVQRLPENPLVNFIWINRGKVEQSPLWPRTSINFGYARLAVDNANRYPDADFFLWVDKKLLDSYTEFLLDSFFGEHARYGNIKIRDLQEIPDYAADPYFIPLPLPHRETLRNDFSRVTHRNVYIRADYARILVLDHCMRVHPAYGKVVYSDIDCPDLRLAETLPLMNRHGIAIHDLGTPMQVSHGYIGLATHNDRVRRSFKALKDNTALDCHGDRLGFSAFEYFLLQAGRPNSNYHNVIGLKNLLPKMKTFPEPFSYRPQQRFRDWQRVMERTRTSGASDAAPAPDILSA